MPKNSMLDLKPIQKDESAYFSNLNFIYIPCIILLITKNVFIHTCLGDFCFRFSSLIYDSESTLKHLVSTEKFNLTDSFIKKDT